MPNSSATPAQLLSQVNTQVCPTVSAALGVVPMLTGVPPAQVALASTAAAKVSQVCAMTASAASSPASADDLDDIVKNALPVVFSALMAVPDPNPAIIAVKDGILAAQILLPGIIAQLKAAQATSTTVTIPSAK